jgi:hypothetical protein
MPQWQPQIQKSAIAILLLLCLGFSAAPTSQRPDSACDAEAFLTAGRPLRSVTAAQVVMQPWRGQHYNYGLFVLPDTVPLGSPVLLTVKGIGVYCGIDYARTKYVEGVTADANHHVLKDHIRTRSAVLAIAQGKLTQLQDPQSWVMWYQVP